MSESRQNDLDSRMLDRVRCYPTVDLVRKLFPDVKMRGGSRMSSPFRNDREPSFSCFMRRKGVPGWKDHGTGESGDNIDLYMKAFPGTSYPDAVNALSVLLFGESAYLSDVNESVSRRTVVSSPRIPVSVQIEPVFRVNGVRRLSEWDVPEHGTYWRERGIADSTMFRYCVMAEVVNTHREGKPVFDRESGLPVVSREGVPILDDGVIRSVAMPNAIGGYVLRDSGGIKYCTSSFPAFILSDGDYSRAGNPLVGLDYRVDRPRYDAFSRVLWINGTTGYSGVGSREGGVLLPELCSLESRTLDGRDAAGYGALLGALSGAFASRVVVVEGMYDALSLLDMALVRGEGPLLGSDLVVLNSTSNVRFCIPFLAAHREVVCCFDRDLRSGTGAKAYDQVCEAVGSYSSALRAECRVSSATHLFAPFKDVNDYYRFLKGFRVSDASMRHELDGGMKPSGFRR